MMTSKVIVIMPENHGTSEKEYMVSSKEAVAVRVILDAMCMIRELNTNQKRLRDKP
jgi:hypothetical protein